MQEKLENISKKKKRKEENILTLWFNDFQVLKPSPSTNKLSINNFTSSTLFIFFLSGS